MPLIQIKSLPFIKTSAVSVALESISQDFAKETAIDMKHLHVTWEFIEPGNYAAGGQVKVDPVKSSHAVLVDMITPDFYDAKAIETMLTSLSASLAKRANIPRKNILINHRYTYSGKVFDAGRIEHW